MKIPTQSLHMARVLHEDDDLVTMEVAKHDDVSFTLEQGDRFLTVLFVHRADSGAVEIWDPWDVA